MLNNKKKICLFFRNFFFKKTIVFILLLSSSYLYCQNAIGRFRGGITGGLTLSKINGADAGYNNGGFHKLGLIGGLLVNTNVTKKDVLQMEVNYLQCGSLQPPDSLNNGYYNISLAYIEIPFIIKHRVNFTVRKKPVDKIDLEAGLSFGQLISQQVIGNTNYIIYGSNAYYNKTIGSIILGVDYNFSTNFYFCLRYSNSFIPAIKRNSLNINTITYTFNRGNNMVFQFSFKYVLDGKKTENVPPPTE